MMQCGQTVQLDFLLKNSSVLVAKQNDINSRYLVVTLTKRGETVDVSEEALYTFNVMRCDGEKKCYRATLIDGKVRAFLSDWAVEKVGVLSCDVSVIEDDEKLTTLPVKVNVVEACCTSDDVEDATGEEIITEILSELAEIENYYQKDKNQITSDTITIQSQEWEYNASINKYEYTVNDNSVKASTYIMANDYDGLLLEGEVISNDGAYTIIAPVKPTGAITLLLIFLKGGIQNERTI